MKYHAGIKKKTYLWIIELQNLNIFIVYDNEKFKFSYFLYANKFLFENMGNKILNTGLPEISAMISIAHS